ncbi:similar to Saccharomyces cerevisiae YMR070W MOT3 Nuclear transcription factor with two Cys2-His2 zinc fingers [Maudiozyma barnettii]|uniref:Similar to Saccharomyces cerevisiae YMR070W MOT3 Nuclear transcription factor with two Cys2-His2 zinc fingers n=1 Tax=Maudiozyma barnettii TaxID=61262 RepID=A0A8H2VK95_9SACH|nr:Mot3p [Kazachstania barnettii]CAB4256874.1 similar to Saccharomyces cerevisiae YMR070W MOT3 Nuclear transcription factor with two Cys2-His2 zinc fingers [Kazachstania barnettii]CAD1785293.1 similar to Saccharomyces cerevisiae YMR070W MOT3 Nuclear transcription factor with two Cys2-His2 zinc fingers [Kazachstania barnettii]
MNYWTNTANGTGNSATAVAQPNKEYERNLLHPLTNNISATAASTTTPRNSYSSYAMNHHQQQQIPSPRHNEDALLQQRFLPQSQSPHYQYQQTLPRIYQNNNGSISNSSNNGMIPSILNNSIIHEDSNNTINYQNNSPSNSSDKSGSSTTSTTNNLLPMRLNSNNNVIGNSSSFYNHNGTTTNNNTSSSSSSSSPFLYHWRSQSQNGTSPSSSISSASSSSNNNNSNLNSNNIQHSPLYQMSIQNQQPLYKVPFIATSMPSNTSYHVKNQLPLLQQQQQQQQRQNSYPQRSSITTINGKNIVNVLGHHHHHHNQNMRLGGIGSISHQQGSTTVMGSSSLNNNTLHHRVNESNSMVHIHGCHLCEKSFKRKSWLKRHLLSHSAERHFLCPWCLSRHKRKDNLLQHMKLKHSTYLLDELKNHNVIFHWEKSSTTHINNIHSLKLDQSNGPNCNNNNSNNIKTLLNEGVLNKEDVKRVLNKLIDQNNA